jgi:hypothetical protein
MEGAFVAAKYMPNWLDQKKRQENDLNMFGNFKKKLISEPIKPIQPIAPASIPETYKPPEMEVPKSQEYVSPKSTPEIKPDTTIPDTTPDTTPDDTPQPADFGATAIISLVIAAVGTAASAAGSASSEKSNEQMSEKARAQNAAQWADQMAQETRAKNLQGLEYMDKQRQEAKMSGRFRNFKRDLLTAARGY